MLRSAVAVTSLGAAVLIAGCGGGSDYKNNLRPPAPINVSAAIVGHQITVSPTRFGAGPVVLIVTNQSTTSQTVTLQRGETNVSDPTCEPMQTTGPINPGDAAPLKINTCPGSYQLTVSDPKVRRAHLTVGPKRPSAQNQVLQP